MTRARDNSFNPFNNQAAGKNILINGAMDFWQRGITLSPAGGAFNPIADRWGTGRVAAAGGYTITRQLTGDTTNLPEIQYCMRIARNNGDTITGGMQTTQNIETINSLPFVNKIVTLSLYIRKGSSYSGGVVNIGLYSGTGVDQNLNISYTGVNNFCSKNITPTDSWVRYSVTGTVPSSATELAAYFYHYASGTATNTNDYIEVTGVQLELGSNATQFSRAGGTIGGELALCQRYYWSIADISLAAHGARIADTDGIRAQAFNLSQTMRSVPTVSFEDAQGTSGAVSIRIFSTGLHTHGVASFALNVNTQKVVNVQRYPYGVSGITNGQPCQVDIYNLKFNSEL